MPTALTAFVFIGRRGETALERWVNGARLASAEDTVRQLARLPGIDRIVAATNDPALADRCAGWPAAWEVDPAGAPFHFGARLAALTQAYPAPAHAYFGAGCAPLLGDEALAAAVEAVTGADRPLAVANNPLSTDWIVFNCADAVQARVERLGRDNALGPVLRREAGVPVRGLLACAATRADIDTPADLFALSLASGGGPVLGRFLRDQPPPAAMLARWRAARDVLARVEGRLTLIGRASASVWAEVERRTRCWVRVLSEERGMTASGRQAAGKVRSLVAAHLERLGPNAFFQELAGLADAVFFDTRVALAHAGRWPSAGDRFASDAGLPERIADEFLRALTTAAVEAPIPVALGGHGVVTGDLYLLLESLTGGGDLPAPASN